MRFKKNMFLPNVNSRKAHTNETAWALFTQQSTRSLNGHRNDYS